MKTKFALLDQYNVVIQVQPNPKVGFIEVPFDTVCGQIKQEDGSFKDPEIILPPDFIAEKQRIEAYLQKGWNTPFDILDDIMRRGLETVMEERRLIKEKFPKS